MTRHPEVLAELCPECLAGPGDWCVYILSAVPEGYSHAPYQLARVGRPTQRLHNGRFHARWLTERKLKRAAEIAQLREFFGRFGDIFEERHA